MSRDKQAEEMFNDLCEADKEFYQFCRGERCQECEYYYSKRDCKNKIYSEKLTEKGYVKSTDLAEEIFAEIEHTARAAIILLKFEKEEKLRNTKTECYEDLLGYIAELKKKYIGKDTNVTTKTRRVGNDNG